MVLKGTIQPDHIPVNNFILLIFGMPPLTFVELGELYQKLQTTKLPDRTMASGGNTEPVEFQGKIPSHHTVEFLAMELWFKQSQAALPGYKRAATLINRSVSGLQFRSYTLTGLFVKARKTATLKMADEGSEAEIEYEFSADDVLPL